jgi:hypothetical protein
MTGMPNHDDQRKTAAAREPRPARDVTSHQGTCFCGAVEVRVTGRPVVMGYCHCDSCRRWAASPVTAFTLWSPDAVEVVRGGEQLGHHQKTERSVRHFCRGCGGHLFTAHPLWGVVDVYAATIPGLAFEPAVHVNYSERVLRLPDGLPKQSDMPAEMGGSGTLLAE